MTTDATPPQPPQPPAQPAAPPPAYPPAAPPAAPYGAPPAAKGPNPPGAAGFILSLVAFVLFIIGLIVVIAWGVNFGLSLAAELQDQGYTTQAEIEQYVREHQAEIAQRAQSELAALTAILWVAMAAGVVGLIVSCVGMAKKNAKKGLAITGLILGILVSLCAVTSVVGGLAQMFVRR